MADVDTSARRPSPPLHPSAERSRRGAAACEEPRWACERVVRLAFAAALLAVAGCTASESKPPDRPVDENRTLPEGHVKAAKAAKGGAPEPGEVGASASVGGEAVVIPEVAPPIDEAAVRASLAAQAVVDDAPPRVLYSWTTREQIEAMAEDRQLFRRSRSGDGRRSRFDVFVDEQGKRLPAPARVLRDEACARKRFAWPNPWATILGFHGERYGDQLLEIVLRPDSVIAVVDAGGPTWRYTDLKGRRLSAAEAKAARSRIAGALHVSPPDLTGMSTLDFSLGWPLREFVLCNEAQVERWSYGTKAILERMSADIDLFKRLARVAEGGPRIDDEWTYAQHLYADVWGRPAPGEGLADDLGAAAAWSSGINADSASLRRIVEAMMAARDAQLGEIVEPRAAREGAAQ
ncbi:MAG: hypothetical protein KC486_29925 [Myxococcales bacterium]|nr:hypothetical protein [Myxococcales bacterium]